MLHHDSSNEEIELELSVWGNGDEVVNPFAGLKRDRRQGGYRDDPLRNIVVKVEIPEFTGHAHPDEFIECLNIVEWVFGLCDISEQLKVKVVAI